MKISIIAAVSSNGVIGKDNQLPWHLPDDMKYFKEKTEGHHVVMGRKNWESIPEKYRPLSKRVNWVLSHDLNYVAKGAYVVNSFYLPLHDFKSKEHNEIFVIGGSSIYARVLPDANKLYITEIHAEIEGDTYFPLFDKNEWIEISRVPHGIDEKHKYAFDFVTYKRK